MSYKKDITEEQSFEIQDELQIRKLIEDKTGWQFELTKNSRYDYDLQLFNWGEDPDNPEDRDLIGYVEVEVAGDDSAWQTGEFPDYWPTVNLLARKIYQSRGSGPALRWGALKDNYHRTVYLKFCNDLSNCFAVAIDEAHRAVQNGTGFMDTIYPDDPYHHTFAKLEPEDSALYWGIDDCVAFITEHLTNVFDDGIQSDISAHRRAGGDR